MTNPRHAPLTRRRFMGLTAAGAAAGTLGFPALVRTARRHPKLIVLGIDGMDPVLLRRYADEGRMPNAARLLQAGRYRPLATTNPPQSPVAWSTVISGTNPGGHGLFDFIARDPVTLAPRFSMAHTEEPPRNLRVGAWRLPLGAAHPRNERRGAAFWEILDQHGVPATLLRMPANFPPTASAAQTLSGMGTPDIHGSYGIFTQFTDAPGERSRDVSGGRIARVERRDGRAICRLTGPVNTFYTDGRTVDLDITVDVDHPRRLARIRAGGTTCVLREGEWSDWVHLEFKMMPVAATVHGICRFYLQRASDVFALYVTPVNMDPEHPAQPISTPPDYARHLAEEIGPYYTQGMPQDTSARQAGVLDDDEFRRHAEHVLDEEHRIFRHELDRFEDGCYFFYYSSLDLNGHMFWRAIDPGHPLYTPELAAAHGDFLPWLYGQMDTAIGAALERAGNDATLLVMSDHGFGSFRRQFNLNSWLMDNGYAAPRDPAARGQEAFFGNIDWDGTRAYGLGLNGLYVNLRGREGHGRVAAGDYDALLERLRGELTALRDPRDDSPVIRRVFRRDEIYSGPCLDEAPDLIIGYAANYRAAWDTVLGKFPHAQLLDNTDPWSGDHAVDPALVPGVLLANRPIAADAPSLEDIAPTVLSHFGLAAPPEMTGRSVLHA